MAKSKKMVSKKSKKGSKKMVSKSKKGSRKTVSKKSKKSRKSKSPRGGPVARERFPELKDEKIFIQGAAKKGESFEYIMDKITHHNKNLTPQQETYLRMYYNQHKK